ncbi:MAG: hypothetical protein M1838_005357 [Thelocarpon superellum]|nr:MAG: hypothetical protein M1838_005357 [Thelocarpon superellum]
MLYAVSPVNDHTLRLRLTTDDHPGQKWFDCAECHQEQEDHPLMQKFDLTFACKKCKKCFRKDAQEFEESDEYCPHCDNHFVLDALTPKPSLKVEGEDARIDSRMLKDDRIRADAPRSIFDVKDAPDRLG